MNRTPQQVERALWYRKHRGVLTEIARLCGVSQTMVSYVVNGRRHSVDGRIEEELRKHGVPGWAKKERL